MSPCWITVRVGCYKNTEGITRSHSIFCMPAADFIAPTQPLEAAAIAHVRELVQAQRNAYLLNCLDVGNVQVTVR